MYYFYLYVCRVNNTNNQNFIKMKKSFIILLGFTATLSLTSCWDFNRDQNQKDAESEGKSILLKAESSKKAIIEEAKASKESSVLAAQARLTVADLDAQATIKRAEAQEAAIRKISAAIQGNPDYLKYEQIQVMKASKGDKVFIATEGNMPILTIK